MGKKREIYEIDGKKYLKCGYCGELKEMSDEYEILSGYENADWIKNYLF